MQAHGEGRMGGRDWGEHEAATGRFTYLEPDHSRKTVERVTIRISLSHARKIVDLDVVAGGVWEDGCNRVYL
jgi:biotin-(acetyl-CoA carboxylase) ligase